MSDLLITHVDVLTDEGVLKNHAIAINNGYITAILNDSEAEKVKVSAKEVLDGTRSIGYARSCKYTYSYCDGSI